MATTNTKLPTTVSGRKYYYKVYFGSLKLPTNTQIYVYYRGIPLYSPATFFGDRYVFSLPVNLEHKMLAGQLIADFSYDVIPNWRRAREKPGGAPTSILLSDRYE